MAARVGAAARRERASGSLGVEQREGAAGRPTSAGRRPPAQASTGTRWGDAPSVQPDVDGDDRERMLEMATRLRKKMTEASMPPKIVAGLEAVNTPEKTMAPTESTSDAPAATLIEARAFCCGCMALRAEQTLLLWS